MNQHTKPSQSLRSPRFVIGFSIISVVVLAAIVPTFLPFRPGAADISRRLLSPDSQHILGCDLYGQDILLSLIYGARTTLYIATLAVFFSVALGTLAGLIAGFFGGLADTLIMRSVDIVMAFPGILLSMALAALLGPSMNHVVFSITATGWAGTARLVRGQVVSLRERDFVYSCRAIGAHPLRIIFIHILPAVVPYLLVTATFSFASVILIEASLTFLGLGAENGPPTWGSLLNQGRTVLAEAPHVSFFPGLVLALVVLAFNFVGDGLRDRFDPKAD